ncbi:Aste57867_19856 [Aphanomyces stellatus]|uniref:Aste57867_19856 protein n=1 Tax=Aphanomyces stellatus TaxID=120398 RepID=A0A485LF35_9STRA|nr:hypothetical protein As57867_019790 [Aphanomyces stellatus]VFT96554.1 Aste57867_19856 [Aphanomyces stellatus]
MASRMSRHKKQTHVMEDWTPVIRLRFEIWKLAQVWQAPELTQKQQQVIAKPILRAMSIRAPPSPLGSHHEPVVASLVDQLLHSPEHSPPKPVVPKKTKQQITLEHLLAFKAKHEKMPFVLAWNIVYQDLVLAKSSTNVSSSKSLSSLKKINTQEKLEEELTNAGVMDNDMVDIEGLIAQLNLRGDQPKKRRPSMI